MSWSSLDSIEAAAGAEFVECGDVRFPRAFASVDFEWRAVRHSVGLLDGRNRRILSLVGGDRVPFLQGMVTNNVATLAVAAGCYAALLTIQGRIVSDLYVYALSDRLLLDVPSGRAEAVRDALEHLIIADDVEFETQPIQPLVSVEGPRAAELLARIANATVDDLAPLQQREVIVGGTSLLCVAVSQTGEPGFRLLGEPDAAAALWQTLQAARATPVGAEALNVLRIEAGIPWHGVDMDDETLVMELGLDTAISFNKGCYLGQEVVERVAARGHVNRKLCGLIADDSRLPPAQTSLMYQDNTVGYITSAVHSPALGKPIALGYVHRSAFEIGTTVHTTVGGTPLTLTVSALPFYRSSITRPTQREETTDGEPTRQTLPV